MADMEAGTADSRVTLTVFKCQECYVYRQASVLLGTCSELQDSGADLVGCARSIPPASSTGHRADLWDVNKWLAEVDCAVITADEVR